MKRPNRSTVIALPAATFGALAAATSGSASIQFFDIADLKVDENSGNSIYFDLFSGDASTATSGTGFQLWAVGGLSSYSGYTDPDTGYYQPPFSTSWNYAYAATPANGQTLCTYDDGSWGNSARLASLNQIGPASTFYWGSPSRNYLRSDWSGSSSGNWQVGSSGYLGLRVGNDTDGYNYGWAEISIGEDSSVTLHSFAYEDTKNTAIQAGAIPEPSTYAALTGLLAGSAVLYSRRRKRAA